MSIPFEEYIVFALLLLGVFGVYYALKLHYVFAFSLVEKTALCDEKKQKIEKIKYYVFAFLKVLLILGLVGMFTFGSIELYEGLSLETFTIDVWHKIPQGFWLDLFLTLLRIAILIVIMRYVLKWIFSFLDRQVELVYLRIHNMIKYTFVLGVVYRIVHFFPFLEEVSEVFLAALILFFILALLITLREVVHMRQQGFK